MMFKKILLGAFVVISTNSYSQTMNWGRLQKTDKHILSLNVGLDYSLTAGLGYGYQLKTKNPIILNAEYSMPFGNNLLDDNKTKIGAIVRFAKAGNFLFTAKIQGVFRRYENDYVRMVNFGIDMSVTAGYYKKKWFIAGETGFDKAIVTHFKHTPIYKGIFPNVQDGWYEPSTGGNFYYGLQSGLSLKRSDITLKVGQMITQDFKTTPSLPFYFQFGYVVKLSAKK